MEAIHPRMKVTALLGLSALNPRIPMAALADGEWMPAE